ncbi:uncharacterized protein PFL1_06705 [Pseudozyma flocculosa PF-1]|uniref:Related to thioesterase family protein n=2 Tax=Pseudozyma flocculosa TaxID=84751 RepID=A0A5C3F339_9BASI|nr:uncharacterized protein PFL1_06705 [Pseudozyma flocculosa PF-1]EPQ25711.1 hypothetical protein PFL1_06705 [Pseudozyma flocculosa PF-1]SPO38914.1 related to thioesterase family protein [Pseudozyma flocculosa]
MASQQQQQPAEQLPVTLQQLNLVHAKVLEANPVYTFLLSDLTLTSVAPGVVTAELPVTRNLMNSHNILHGCTSATIIDWIGGIVIASTSPDRFQKRGVSVDIHVTYVGAAKEGETLLIKGTAQKVGSRLAFINVEVKARKPGSTDERVVVTGSHTKFVG